MAIVNNTSSEIGDVIIIEDEVPLIGVISFLSFTDDIIGETADRFFFKEFSYSLNGISFTPYVELTNTNLQAIQIEPDEPFYIRYRYTRNGTDTSGLLSFNSVTLLADIEEFVCRKPVTLSSIFSDLACGNLEVEQFCINLTNKLYEEGIIPKYVVRRQSTDIDEDEDYIAFWKSISCFFSTLYVFARRFANFRSNEKILIEYLRQRDIYLCGNETIEDLQLIAENLLNEIYKRGTQLISKKKTDELVDGTFNRVDGELLRLLCVGACEEFLFNTPPPQHNVWSLNRSSPLYRGLTERGKFLNKTTNLFFRESFTLSDVTSDNKIVLLPNTTLTVVDNNKLQISKTDGINQADIEILANDLNSNLDYEIYFNLEKTSSDPVFYSVFAEFRTEIGQDILLRPSNNALPSEFFAPFTLAGDLNIPNQQYNFRGIIFKQNTGLEPDDSYNKPSIDIDRDVSSHLIFNSQDANGQPFSKICSAKFTIRLAADPNPTSNLIISNLGVRPVMKPYGNFYAFNPIQTEIWAKNNNKQYGEEELKDIINTKLIPYNSNLTTYLL